MLDFGSVRGFVTPGASQIFGTQRRIDREQFRFADTRAARLNQNQNRNSGLSNPCFSTTNIWRFLNAGRRASEIEDDVLQQLRLLLERKPRQHRFNRMQRRLHLEYPMIQWTLGAAWLVSAASATVPRLTPVLRHSAHGR